MDVSRNTVYRMIRDYELNHNIYRNNNDKVNYDGEKEEQDIQQYLNDEVK